MARDPKRVVRGWRLEIRAVREEDGAVPARDAESW
jgi:hypothetical protein